MENKIDTLPAGGQDETSALLKESSVEYEAPQEDLQESKREVTGPVQGTEDMERGHIVKYLRWAFFGVIFSLLPVIISAIVSLYLKYNFTHGRIMEYFVNFVLVIFAVATNACSYATEGMIRIGCMIVSIIAMVVSGFIYIIFLAIAQETLYSSLLPTAIVALIVFIVSASIGFFIEYNEYKRCRNQKGTD